MRTLGEIAGKFSVEWDERRGSGLVTTQGFWTENDVAKFYPLLTQVAEMSRVRHGHALLLFDASNAVVQDGSLIQPTAPYREIAIQDTDRVALILASNPLKLQIKRNNAAIATTEYFTSRSASDRWLHAHIATPLSARPNNKAARRVASPKTWHIS